MTISAPSKKKRDCTVVTITNQKGGVGKTTITFHLSVFLAELGYKTLVIDLDGQGNISGLLCPDRGEGLHTPMLFEHMATLPKPLSSEFGVDLAYCDEGGDMAVYEIEMKPEGINQVQPFYQHISALSEEYDFIICDTPPTYGVKMMAACISANCIFAPVELAGFAVDGVKALDRCLQTISKVVGTDITLDGLICNKFDMRNSEHVNALEIIRSQAGKIVLKTVLRDAAPIDAAILNRTPAWRRKKTGHQRESAKMMLELMTELSLRIGVPKTAIKSFEAKKGTRHGS